VSDGAVAYESALATMSARAEAIARGESHELIWLLEHHPLYTAGTGSRPQELIEAQFPVHAAGRGSLLGGLGAKLIGVENGATLL
jgi:lipoyl(octanoyl) transferase